MESKKRMQSKSRSGLIKFLYVISAILALVFVFMLIINVNYIINYIAAYGLSFGDMCLESIKYIITGSLNYFVYALLVFCAAKILSVVSCKSADSAEGDVDDPAYDGEREVDVATLPEKENAGRKTDESSSSTDEAEKKNFSEDDMSMSNDVETTKFVESAPSEDSSEPSDKSDDDYSDDYRFEPDKVISWFDVSREQQTKSKSRIVEEATRERDED